MSKKDESREDYNGGKWPNRDGGVAIPEFIDNAGAGNREESVADTSVNGDPNAPDSIQPFQEKSKKRE